MSDTRYPYTYACDFIRSYGGTDSNGVKICRGEASSIIGGVAIALGVEKENLAKKIADYYLENEEEISKASTEKMLRSLGIKN